MNIDTGQIIKAQRASRHGPMVQALGKAAARHWGAIVQVLRVGLRFAQVLPAPVLPAVTRLGRRFMPTDWLPQVGSDLPGPGPARPKRAAGGDCRKRQPGSIVDPATDAQGDTELAQDEPAADPANEVVYFATCINSLFGPAEPNAAGVGQAVQRLAQLTGTRLTLPPHLSALCCGTVWHSKGLTGGSRLMAQRVFGVLWQATDRGRLPVMADAASCSHSLDQLAQYLPPEQAAMAEKLQVMDSVSYVARHLIGRLEVPHPLESVAVHPNCSAVHLGAVDDLVAVAELLAQTVYVPKAWGCCGFAGDRGMLHPELTASATQPEANELAAAESARAKAGAASDGQFSAYVSANRTCELGLSRATGRPYRHVLEVLAEVAQPLG